MNEKDIWYKEKYTFEERCERVKSMKQKYPQKIPIVLVPEKNIALKSCQFLVEKDITFMQFIALVRKNYAIELKSHEAIFCIVNKILPPGVSMLFEIYNQHQEPDGILYIHIKKESTFG
jgi:hypothetical protein